MSQQQQCTSAGKGVPSYTTLRVQLHVSNHSLSIYERMWPYTLNEGGEQKVYIFSIHLKITIWERCDLGAL